MRREDIYGENPEYIGDGVYASHDRAGQIWLQTEREEGRVERIALEPSVFLSLCLYEKRLREKWAEEAGRSEQPHER
jgi:hypothetical protein